jgi:hypothetical protein
MKIEIIYILKLDFISFDLSPFLTKKIVIRLRLGIRYAGPVLGDVNIGIRNNNEKINKKKSLLFVLVSLLINIVEITAFPIIKIGIIFIEI